MRLVERIEEPFEVSVWDDVFSNYDQLLEAFPKCIHPLFQVGKKYHLNQRHPEFDAFLVSCPVWMKAYRDVTESLGSQLGLKGRAKFEFSALPADGGSVLPHPDTPEKKWTAVFYFPQEGWRPEYGGAFQMYRHKLNPTADYTNWRGDWAEVETVREFAFTPNRMVLMRRTNQSLHGVSPLKGPEGMFRQTLTVNWI